jgi:hypothetical protein
MLLSRAHESAGDPIASVDAARSAMAQAPGTGSPILVTRVTLRLGTALAAVDPVAADDVLRRAQALARELGDQRSEQGARKLRQGLAAVGAG